MGIYVFVVWMRWIAVFRIRIFRIAGDLQDWDDALHRFHPHPSPLPSRERGFRRLCCLVVSPHTLPLWIVGHVCNDWQGMVLLFTVGLIVLFPSRGHA